MASRTIDLHTHSRCSDGSDSPATLVAKAAEVGLAAVALTDHDSLSGIEAASAEARVRGIGFIPGIEVAVRDRFGELHLLGLWMGPPSQRMRETLALLRESRMTRNLAVLEALDKLDMPLSMDEVERQSGGQTIGRPHIALAMKARGYVTRKKEAFERYLGWGAKAFVPRKLFSPEEGLDLLKEEGATIALAHPCLSPDMTRERLDGILTQFKALGMTALEAYHSTHGPEQTRMCVELAAKHGLLLSGGSDYHGSNKEGVALGRGRGGLRVPYALLERMREARQQAGLWV